MQKKKRSIQILENMQDRGLQKTWDKHFRKHETSIVVGENLPADSNTDSLGVILFKQCICF